MIKDTLKKRWILVCWILTFILCCPAALSAQEAILLINPTDQPIVQRCFIEYNNTKRTECAAVGEVAGVHYAIDLSNGSIINTWRGAFIDATSMWTDRGILQLAKPLGKVNVLSNKPAFALLGEKEVNWPDSIQEGYDFKGYQLDNVGRPIFSYTFKGIEIEDRITPEKEHQGLIRNLKFTNLEKPFYLSFLLAESNKIEKIGKNLYAIGDLTYYIKIDEGKSHVSIKKEKDRFRLVTQADKNKQINYSIIW